MFTGKIVGFRGSAKQDAPLIYKQVNREGMCDLTGTLYPTAEYEHEKINTECENVRKAKTVCCISCK